MTLVSCGHAGKQGEIIDLCEHTDVYIVSNLEYLYFMSPYSPHLLAMCHITSKKR